jgi:threonine/homoserine/homoserine lactone efflux protein
VTGVVLAGLLAGWAVAVPVGPVAAYLVALSARSGWRTGTAAALGVAAADGIYALLAAVGGTGLVQVVRPAVGPARWVGAAVLLCLAAHGVVTALRSRPGTAVDGPPALAPRAAFARLLALTMVNPATVLTFAALVVGSGATVTGHPASALVFAAAAAGASAAWQVLLATSGAALGGLLTGRRGRVGTGLVSSGVMAALALALVL